MDGTLGRSGIKTEVKLPEDVQAQLDRIAELEKRNAELMADKVTLEQNLIERGIQAQHWEDQPVSKEMKDADGETTTVTLYHHKIDLPPSGGVCLRRNGVEYYHGQFYDFSVDELRDVRDQEFRAWAHENSIKGSNENVYRPHTNTRLSMRGMRA